MFIIIIIIIIISKYVSIWYQIYHYAKARSSNVTFFDEEVDDAPAT